METRNLLFELSHPLRYEILQLLIGSPLRLTAIAKKVDANAPEISRHLDRLKDAGIIEKNPEGLYLPTPMGYLILEHLPVFEFITRNKDYFLSHDLLGLPPGFISRLGDLEDGEIMEGSIKNIELAKNIILGSEERLLAASKEYMPNIVTSVLDKLKNGLYYRAVVDEDFLINEKENLSLPELDNYIFEEVKVVARTPAVGVGNEKKALIVFPDRDGKMDYSVAFYSTNERFRSWFFDLIEELWRKGKQFHRI